MKFQLIYSFSAETLRDFSQTRRLRQSCMTDYDIVNIITVDVSKGMMEISILKAETLVHAALNSAFAGWIHAELVLTWIHVANT